MFDGPPPPVGERKKNDLIDIIVTFKDIENLQFFAYILVVIEAILQ